MAYEETTHELTLTLHIVVKESDEEDEDRRYMAHCNELSGCSVFASTEGEALDLMGRAIDVWFDSANRQMDEFDVQEFL